MCECETTEDREPMDGKYMRACVTKVTEVREEKAERDQKQGKHEINAVDDDRGMQIRGREG